MCRPPERTTAATGTCISTIIHFPVRFHEEHGKWSFERVRYYSESSRKWREHRIERIRRHVDTRPGADWLPRTKEFMCATANLQFEEEGQRGYFTTLTNQERGCGRAEKRRGPKASALLKRGEVSLDRSGTYAANALRFQSAPRAIGYTSRAAASTCVHPITMRRRLMRWPNATALSGTWTEISIPRTHKN